MIQLSGLPGRVHKGFAAGLPGLVTQIFAIVGDDPFVMVGHSRGAAQATISTGLALALGKKAARRVVFGEPRSGDAAFCQFVAAIPSASYCNVDAAWLEFDPITLLPPDAPPLLPYARVEPLTYIRAAVSQGNPWKGLGPLALHFMPDCADALSNFYAQRTAA